MNRNEQFIGLISKNNHEKAFIYVEIIKLVRALNSSLARVKQLLRGKIMHSSTKKRIKIGLIFMAILCIVSLPGLSFASARYQPYDGFSRSQSDFAINAWPSHISTLAGLSSNVSVLATSIGRFNGTISLSASLPSGWSSNFELSSLELQSRSNWTKLTISVPSDAVVGTYKVEVSGTNGSVTRSANVTVNVVQPDFRLFAWPSTLRMLAGSTENATIGVCSLYRFNDTVSLTAASPAGWPASTLALNALYVNSSGFNMTTLSVNVPSDAAAGKYVVEVTGVSGSLSHKVNVTVQVVTPDFSISARPSHASMTAGSSQNITVKVSPLYRFNGTVTLTAEFPAGITSSPPDPTSVEVKFNASSYATLNITIPSTTATGKYVIAVTATSGGLTHKANVTVQVVTPEFRLSTYTPYLWVHAGSSKNVTLKVSPLNGFTGTVTLSLSAPADWTSTVLAQTTLTIGSTRSNSTKLTIVVPSTAAVGDYDVSVTGTSGSLTNSTTIKVMVK